MSSGADEAKTLSSGPCTSQAAEGDIEYLRRAYASTREWYAAAETKAQLLLAANGVFVTILFGGMFGKAGDVQSGTSRFGIITWIFISASIVALVSAITCAAQCLWSLHGKAGSEFARMGVDPADPSSYRPEALWYFGHLAYLQHDAAVDILRRADRRFEIEALSYNLVDLARKVLRKHRWVNAGWAFTALALVTLAAAGASYLA